MMLFGRGHQWIRMATLSLALLALPRIAAGQDVRGYVGGALTISPWGLKPVRGGTPSLDFDNTSTESTAPGVATEVGWLLNRRVALGAEIGLPFRREVTQTYSYFTPYISVSRYRDLTLFAIARALLNQDGRVGVGLVGGGGSVQQSSLERVAEGHFGSYTFGPFGLERDVSRWTWGLTGGVDVSLQAARHVSIVPQFRVLAIDRGHVIDGDVFAFGFSTVVYRYGVSLRAAF
jgi:hypothetical protein